MTRKKKIAGKLKNSKLQLNELMVKGIEAYEVKDYKTSFSCFSQAVLLGDGNAAWLVGRQYYYGQGCSQSYRRAAKYYKMAAAKKVKEAWYALATCFKFGLGVHRSNRNAIKCLILSADDGYSLAQEFLAKKYLAGDEVERDEVKACHYFGLSAEQGCANSQYYMFLMFKMGYVSQDIAIKNLKLAAENGHGKAQCCLGELYFYGDLGLPEDKTMAFYWCERAAQQGDAEALYCCGLAYQQGEGTMKNLGKAIEYHRAAAQHGYLAAHLQLYRAIVQSARSDLYKEGFRALINGARLGDKECMYGLSLVYQIGVYGAPTNPRRAEYWQQKYLNACR